MSLSNLLIHLETINKKAKELDDQGFKKAALAASNLHTIMIQAIKNYKIQQNKVEFERICTDAIDNARPVLAKYRGLKQILNALSSIIVSVLTIGIANFITGQKWLFSTETDSEQKLNKLEQSFKESLLTMSAAPLKPIEEVIERPLDIHTGAVDEPIIIPPLTDEVVLTDRPIEEPVIGYTGTIDSSISGSLDDSSLTTDVIEAPLQLTESPAAEIEFLNALKELLNERIESSTKPIITDPIKMTHAIDTIDTEQQPESLFRTALNLFKQTRDEAGLSTAIDLYKKYKDAKGLLNHTQIVIPKIKAIIPLVSKPMLFNYNGVKIMPPSPSKNSTLLSGKPKYLLDGLANYTFDGLTIFIPGILGFQNSAFVRPLRTLETLSEHSATVGGSALALLDSLSFADYRAWPKVLLIHHYKWNPRGKRIEQFAHSMEIATQQFNNLSKAAMQFVAQSSNVDLPTDQFIFTDVSKSPHFKPVLHILASAANLLRTDYELPLGSFRAANSFKLLRDMNFLGQQGMFETVYNLHNWMFKISAASTLFSASKDLFELHKNSGVLKQPLKAIRDVAQQFLKSSSPWPDDSYNIRLDTYAFLNDSLLGAGNELSLFEFKIQNLLYNLTVNSGTVSALALTKAGALAHIPYYIISNIFRGSDHYTWYPNVVEMLLGDALPGLGSSPATNKVLLHFINKLAWERLIVPLLIELPMKGLTTATSRVLAEKMFNNPDFILNLRFQLKGLLKNALFNPNELVEFEDFEPPLAIKRTSDIEQALKKVKLTTQTINIGTELFSGLDQAPPKAIRRHAFYNLRDPFIDFMTSSAVHVDSDISFKKNDFNYLLDQATELLENNLGVQGLTKGKKKKSFIELLAYPIVSFSIWAWNIFGDEPQKLLKTIENATTLRELPKPEEVEEMVDTINDSIEESRYRIVLQSEVRSAKRFIKKLKSSYEDKIETLSTNIVDAKKDTKKLFKRHGTLKKLIIEDINDELPIKTLTKIGHFKDEIKELIAKHAKDSEASSFSNLLTALPDELDTLIKNKTQQNLNHICFRVFLQFLESRSAEELSIDEPIKELMRIVNQILIKPDSVFSQIIKEDLVKLNQVDNSGENINKFADAMAEITREIILLSSIFISNHDPITLSLKEYNKLCERYNTLQSKYSALNIALPGIFINAINQTTQIALGSIRDKQQIMKNHLAEIDAELEPLNILFEQLKSDAHLTLPTEKQVSAFNKLTQVSEDHVSKPQIIREYREEQLLGKNSAQFKILLILKLDGIVDARKREIEKLIADKTVTVAIMNEKSTRFRNEVESFIKYFLPEDIEFRIQCERKINLFDNEIITFQKKYDARTEITTALSELSTYITKINDTRSLMSTVWIRTAQLLLVHQEMKNIIARTIELLKPYTTYHNDACKAVLRTMGLTINEEGPVDTQVEVSISNHLKTHIYKLIKTDLDALIGTAVTTMKGSEPLADIRHQQLKTLNEKFCSSENIKFFGTRIEIERYILQNVEENMSKLAEAKTTKFIEGLAQKIKALNIQFDLVPPSRFNFFAPTPISRVLYDERVHAIKNEVAVFEPSERRDFIMKSISGLFMATVKSPLATLVPQVSEVTPTAS